MFLLRPQIGDDATAVDNYWLVQGWLDRFPHYRRLLLVVVVVMVVVVVLVLLVVVVVLLLVVMLLLVLVVFRYTIAYVAAQARTQPYATPRNHRPHDETNEYRKQLPCMIHLTSRFSLLLQIVGVLCHQRANIALDAQMLGVLLTSFGKGTDDGMPGTRWGWEFVRRSAKSCHWYSYPGTYIQMQGSSSGCHMVGFKSRGVAS